MILFQTVRQVKKVKQKVKSYIYCVNQSLREKRYKKWSQECKQMQSLLGAVHLIGELARLGGLAHLGEMIFITCLYGIFYLTSIKKFVTLLEKDCFDQVSFKQI